MSTLYMPSLCVQQRRVIHNRWRVDETLLSTKMINIQGDIQINDEVGTHYPRKLDKYHRANGVECNQVIWLPDAGQIRPHIVHWMPEQTSSKSLGTKPSTPHHRTIRILIKDMTRNSESESISSVSWKSSAMKDKRFFLFHVSSCHRNTPLSNNWLWLYCSRDQS